MKKLLTAVLLSGMIFGASSQTVDFHDSVFHKALLCHLPKIDVDLDGEFSKHELSLVEELNLNRKGLKDLSQIHLFKNLKKLSCSDNSIDTLELKNMDKLEKLNCRGNNLKQLTLEYSPMLSELIAGQNMMKTINISDCQKLEVLYLQQNELQSIDLSDFPNLRNLVISRNELTTIDLSNNPKLNQLNIAQNKLREIDISANTVIQYVYVDKQVNRVMNNEQRKRDVSPFLVKPGSPSN